jgi:hypothetical protein
MGIEVGKALAPGRGYEGGMDIRGMGGMRARQVGAWEGCVCGKR